MCASAHTYIYIHICKILLIHSEKCLFLFIAITLEVFVGVCLPLAACYRACRVKVLRRLHPLLTPVDGQLSS